MRILNKASLYPTTLNNAIIGSLSARQQITFERATEHSDVCSQEQQVVLESCQITINLLVHPQA
jgi:hypothetical protein